MSATTVKRKMSTGVMSFFTSKLPAEIPDEPDITTPPEPISPKVVEKEPTLFDRLAKNKRILRSEYVKKKTATTFDPEVVTLIEA